MKKLLISSLSVATILAASTTMAPAVMLSVDSNRDGVVDFDADLKSKNSASLEHGQGALFLFNCDSDMNTGEPDWADEKVNGPNDLKDLAIIRMEQMPDIAKDAEITVLNTVPHVNLFIKNPSGQYQPVRSGVMGNIPTDWVRNDDVELRIEATQFPAKNWDGWNRVTVQVVEGEKYQRDSVALQVAPWVMLSNSQEVDTVYVRQYPGRNDVFLQQLGELVPEAGADLFVIPAGEPYSPHNIWLQDTLEIGYTEMPGVKMPVVLKANRGKPLDSFPKDELLGPDYGFFESGDFRSQYGSGSGSTQLEWLDWFGNLEVSVPVPGYPLGRKYYGGVGFEDDEAQLNPDVTAMLEAQHVQGPPVRFDVGWLVIKHVDEMIAWLPMKDQPGEFRVMVPDTSLMIDWLSEMEAEGLGDQSMLEIYHPGSTVSSLLADSELVKHNRMIQKEKIEPNITLLKKEFGVTDDQIIRVPFLLNPEGETMMPNMINSLVINGKILAPDPHGPKHDGIDRMQEAFRDLVSETGHEVYYLDDRQYHKWSGNVHCGTNALRKPFDTSWWQMTDTGGK